MNYPIFNTDGDILFITSDGIKYRVHSEVLEDCCDLLERVGDVEITDFPLNFDSTVVAFTLKKFYDIHNNEYRITKKLFEQREQEITFLIWTIKFIESLGPSDKCPIFIGNMMDIIKKNSGNYYWFDIVTSIYEDPSPSMVKLADDLAKAYVKEINYDLVAKQEASPFRDFLLKHHFEYHEKIKSKSRNSW